MASAPNPGPSVTVAAAGLASVGIWRLLAIAAPHLAALADGSLTLEIARGQLPHPAAWQAHGEVNMPEIKAGKAYVQAGGGWVNDSTPEGEFDETVNKAKAMLKAVALAETFAGK